MSALSLRVTATDTSLASAFDDFVLTVANTNDAPTVAAPMADQAATEDSAFSFTVPAGSFADIDAGDTLSYAATLSSGAALPAWLAFDAATRTFSGTASNSDVGALSLRVTATDTSLASAFDDFVLTVANTNDAPTVAAPIADQAATEDSAFSFTVPAGSFADIDAGDTLSYAATLSSGAALPAWLAFDAATRTFSGIPTRADIGAISVRVTAMDTSLASAFDDFALTVRNVNHPPTVLLPIADQAATEDLAFGFTLPAGSFGDSDAGDLLVYGATLSDGAALPAWLAFDAATRTFTGTPSNADVASLTLRVSASDRSLASTFDDFVLTVANVNDSPVSQGPLDLQQAFAFAPVQFQLPAAAFVDPDVGDTLRYSATLVDGAALPAWLRFDPQTRIFSGTPADADIGSLVVRVVATDISGAAAQSRFVISVLPQPVQTLPLADEAVAPRTPPPEPPAQEQVVQSTAATEAEPAALVDAGPATSERTEALAPLPAIETVLSASVPGATPGADVTIAAVRPDESVLAAALAPQFSDIAPAPASQMFKDDGMLRKLEEMKRQMQVQGVERRTLVASTIALSSGLSIGYVVWLVRGGILISSMLSALPAWQMIDPLPVLSASRGAKARGKGMQPDGDDPEVERLFDEAAPVTAAAAAIAQTPPVSPTAPGDAKNPDGVRQ